MKEAARVRMQEELICGCLWEWETEVQEGERTACGQRVGQQHCLAGGRILISVQILFLRLPWVRTPHRQQLGHIPLTPDEVS